jgi:wyosine [tRNA(Phe)-imidazoG37] synthetase (radical SAM superfamily)
MNQQSRNRYIYGPVRSWRSGLSLGVDPIGNISTCSFNCAYCQLGQIQDISNKVKVYVPTEFIIEDLKYFETESLFTPEALDVITFAGSGEPSLAENLAEIIEAIRILYPKIPISILTNATMLNNPEVRQRLIKADLLSLKLDAPNDEILRSINQPAAGISMASIISGIKALKQEVDCLHKGQKAELQLQMMFMPKFIKTPGYIEGMASIILELGISKLQINTPTRPKPKGKEYHIDTRGNHYASETLAIEFIDLPVISETEAFAIEDRLRTLASKHIANLEIINVYQR